MSNYIAYFPLLQSPFPVRSDRKPSYSAAPVVWIKQSGIQSDIQKVLRHARKLPEKTTQFYKELNRLQKAAVCMGWEIRHSYKSIYQKTYTYHCQVLRVAGGSGPDLRAGVRTASLHRQPGLRHPAYLRSGGPSLAGLLHVTVHHSAQTHTLQPGQGVTVTT